MSKQYNSPEVTLESVQYEVKTYDISNLEGKILTFIDATFSDTQQRKAQKDIMRGIIWDWIIPKCITGSSNEKGNATGKL